MLPGAGFLPALFLLMHRFLPVSVSAHFIVLVEQRGGLVKQVTRRSMVAPAFIFVSNG